MAGDLAERFGKCVRQLRTDAGLSQVVFGERCGFYQTYLSRIERGQANPTLNAMEVIANALGLTVFDLFDLMRAEPAKENGQQA
ncbi:MAG: helix-turn-helix domain-containing protein [Betaproteobacteria bacterium]|nr:helix-turn-helix domain-containing protein [Betaproteobacteria bacterium]